jgi:hypothetical protein
VAKRGFVGKFGSTFRAGQETFPVKVCATLNLLFVRPSDYSQRQKLLLRDFYANHTASLIAEGYGRLAPFGITGFDQLTIQISTH